MNNILIHQNLNQPPTSAPSTSIGGTCNGASTNPSGPTPPIPASWDYGSFHINSRVFMSYIPNPPNKENYVGGVTMIPQAGSPLKLSSHRVANLGTNRRAKGDFSLPLQDLYSEVSSVKNFRSQTRGNSKLVPGFIGHFPASTKAVEKQSLKIADEDYCRVLNQYKSIHSNRSVSGKSRKDGLSKTHRETHGMGMPNSGGHLKNRHSTGMALLPGNNCTLSTIQINETLKIAEVDPDYL